MIVCAERRTNGLVRGKGKEGLLCVCVYVCVSKWVKHHEVFGYMEVNFLQLKKKKKMKIKLEAKNMSMVIIIMR